MTKLEGKIPVVTSASKGIDVAIAQYLQFDVDSKALTPAIRIWF